MPPIASKRASRSGYRFPLVLAPDDNNTVLVTCPDVPDMITFGRNRADAIRRARGALDAVIDHRIERGLALPMPRRPERGQPIASPSPAIVRRMAAYSIKQRVALAK
ncbi:MAG: type II toxin-antitoxin system HicB family antitoxin [Bradyrhizobium sp.]